MQRPELDLGIVKLASHSGLTVLSHGVVHFCIVVVRLMTISSVDPPNATNYIILATKLNVNVICLTAQLFHNYRAFL